MAHYNFLGMNKQIEKDNYLLCADICLILEKMIWKIDNIKRNKTVKGTVMGVIWLAWKAGTVRYDSEESTISERENNKPITRPTSPTFDTWI